jgi:RNA polymerase sigma-70 factor, ECF subfamily
MLGPHDYMHETERAGKDADGPMNTSARLTLGSLTTESEPPPEAAADELLARRGDADSFAELYERYLPAVYHYVTARVRAREAAEDLTSEAFRQMWTSRHGYGHLGTFRAWLFCIVRRTVADHYRRRPPMTQLAQAVAEQVMDDRPTPEDLIVQDERQLHVRRLLSELDDEQQEVLSLRFAAELPYAEIAVVIGKREDAVKKIAYRALQLLRERNIHV